MPQLDAKLSQILDELQKAAGKYAPGALNLGLETIRAIAIIHMAWAALGTIMFIVALVTYLRTYWVWQASPSETPMIAVATNVASFIVAAVFFVVVCNQLFTVANWLALIDPRLALAKMILDRVGLVP